MSKSFPSASRCPGRFPRALCSRIQAWDSLAIEPLMQWIVVSRSQTGLNQWSIKLHEHFSKELLPCQNRVRQTIHSRLMSWPYWKWFQRSWSRATSPFSGSDGVSWNIDRASSRSIFPLAANTDPPQVLIGRFHRANLSLYGQNRS